MADELWRWDATALAAAIRSKRVSVREVVGSCITRMRAVNLALNAVTVDLGDAALAEADRADAAVARGDTLGGLHGVPVTIKENVDQAGCATTNGVVAYRDAIAAHDCPPVANWKKAGAIVIGRTNTPAFSFRLDTDNDLRGRTFNPWSREHTAGGSSGGAAASVAAGMVPLAHGNDIAGSVRFPAYCCGVAGIRPSFGRVPAWNPSQKSERPIAVQMMSVQGPLARSVRDLRLGLAAMAQPDSRDPWWVPAPLEGLAVPKRVAIVRDAADLGGATPTPAIAAALDQAARSLADAGYEIVADRTPGFTAAAQLWFEMLVPQFRRFMQADFERDGDDGIRTAMRYMVENVPDRGAEANLLAMAARLKLAREWSVFLDRVPLVLAPVSCVPPYRRGFDLESAACTAEVWRECATLMALPVLGLPGIAVPTGMAGGLPVGVQIIAPRFREDLCFAAAEAIEAGAGMRERLPPDSI